MRHSCIPLAMYAKVRDHIAELLQCGDIRSTDNSWSFPVVLVRQKNKKNEDVCLIQRTDQTYDEKALSLSRIEEPLMLLQVQTIFTVLIWLHAG